MLREKPCTKIYIVAVGLPHKNKKRTSGQKKRFLSGVLIVLRGTTNKQTQKHTRHNISGRTARANTTAAERWCRSNFTPCTLNDVPVTLAKKLLQSGHFSHSAISSGSEFHWIFARKSYGRRYVHQCPACSNGEQQNKIVSRQDKEKERRRHCAKGAACKQKSMLIHYERSQHHIRPEPDAQTNIDGTEAPAIKKQTIRNKGSDWDDI